jgi:ParB family chromosome partitioning protein
MAPSDGEQGAVGIEVAKVSPSPFQPRREFDQGALERLADSIRRSGLMQPVIVRPVGGGYELVAGERRWRAAKIAGLERIPALVRSLSDSDSAEWALVENLQREDLDPIERAFALRALGERFGLTHAEIGERIGLERSSVANLVRLTELEEPIRRLIAEGKLTAGHGRALLAVPAGAERARLAAQAAQLGWNVREMERATRPAAPRPAAAPGARPASLTELERQLGEHLGTKVTITTDKSGKRGLLTLEFYGMDHFDGLMTKIAFRMT